jgi:hypothetical protein
MLMGPQKPATLTAVLQSCGDADGGFIFAPREFLGLVMRTRRSMLNQSLLTLNYAATVFDGEFKPIDNDQVLRNDVTVTDVSGNSATSTITSGPNNINDPTTDSKGVGRYDTTYERNPYTTKLLLDLAQYGTFLGTWDEIRIPQTTVSVERAPFTADLNLTHDVAVMHIGDAYKITNLPTWIDYDPLGLLVRGVIGKISNNETNRGWSHTWVTQLYGPFMASSLDSSNTNALLRLGASNTQLAGPLTTTATNPVIYTPTGALWRLSSGAVAGTYPMDIKMAGEQMSATALANVTLSFVAAGTASHGNNASVTPGAPAGLATGDLMVMWAAIRTTAGAVTTPTGWTVIASLANATLFGRIAQASGNAPTVAFTGGAAGDDTSAQIAAFRPSSPFASASTLGAFTVRADWQINAAAQDIANPAAQLGQYFFNDSLILYLGWKQDDWTSVASPGTEIAEFFTTTGNDQGMVWAYTIQTTATAIASGSFVVTGGTSQVSKGAVVVLHPRHQLLTVTRSSNSVVKTQAAGETELDVVNPIRLQL